MDKVLGNKKAIIIFLAPALLVFTTIVILPIFCSSYYSPLEWDGITQGSFVGLKNFVLLLTDSNNYFIKSVVNSAVLVALSLFIQLPLALILALVLAGWNIKGEKFFRTVYFIPVIISTVVIGQLWLKIYHPDYGLLNSLLKGVGLGKFVMGWLGSEKTSLLAAFIPIVWQYVGYHMLLMYASAKSIPNEIYEAAGIDGASRLGISIRITIPLIAPMIKICSTFAIIGSLKSFDLIYILTNGGPVHSSEVPSTLMYNTIFLRYQYGFGSAMAVFIILECLILTILLQKVFKTEEVKY